ncbi:MAG: ABC transporter permease [Clostridiaceae bacterium BRH_c20a]|nr:MAG: ABC transporter permease [Clostridiaceae bacterium BRH_c20a]
MMQSFLKAVHIYWYMVEASIRAQMQYRYAFVMNIVGWMMHYTGMGITIWVLLYSFQTLEGWVFWELIFLFALSVLSWSISIIFFFHFRTLDQYIVKGTFDRFLVRPIHPFFHFMAMKFDIGAIGQLLFSILAFILAYSKLSLHWSFWKWTVFSGALLGGALIQGGIMVLISAIAFWTTRSERVFWVIMFPLRNLINYPLSIFPRAIQMVITFILPFAFVNYLPSLLLLNKTDSIFPPFWGSLSLLVGIIFFWLSLQVWLKGVNKYNSTGS